MKKTSNYLKTLIQASLGEIESDLVLVGGDIVNVYTKEIIKNTSIAIKKDKIVYVGKIDKKFIGRETKVLNLSGKILIPGFIETHTHIAQVYRLKDFIKYAIKGGTTTVITEVGEIGNVFGKEGIDFFIKELKQQLIKVFITLPPLTPPFPKFETSLGIKKDEYFELLDNDFVLGLGEAYWPRVLNCEKTILDIFSYALNKNKFIQGHSAGAKNEKLAAYISAGVSSCHEPISIRELIDRVRNGIHIILREGSVRKDFSNIFKFKDIIDDYRNITISTDGITANELIEEGSMDSIARKAVKLGFSFIDTVQLLTLNAAYVFGLEKEFGGIAPFKYADIQVLPDKESFKPDIVISNGKILYQEENFCEEGRIIKYPKKFYNNIGLNFLKEKDLKFKIKHKKEVKVRAIHLSCDLITEEKIFNLQVNGQGDIVLPDNTDLLRYVVFNRYGKIRKQMGFLSGTGIKKGAYASTLNWEDYQPVVFGKSLNDMLLAINRLIEMNGGIVLVKDGKIISELPLSIGGIISDLPIEKIAQKEKEIISGLKSIGCKIKNPYIVLQTLSFTGLPFIRLTDKGLVDIKKQQLISIFID